MKEKIGQLTVNDKVKGTHRVPNWLVCTAPPIAQNEYKKQ